MSMCWSLNVVLLSVIKLSVMTPFKGLINSLVLCSSVFDTAD